MSRSTITPRWLTYADASRYTSLSVSHLESLVRKQAIVSKNVVLTGSTRGRRLIDRESLDAFIDGFDSAPAALAMNKKGGRA